MSFVRKVRKPNLRGPLKHLELQGSDRFIPNTDEDAVTEVVEENTTGFAATVHTHVIGDVTNLQSSLNAKAATTVTDGLNTRLTTAESDIAALEGNALSYPGGANLKLDGEGDFSAVLDTQISTSDNTTNNVSTTKHGFCPKAPNDTAQYLRGDGTWATVSASGDGLGPDGDKGDITVGGSGTTLTIDNDAVTFAKMQNATQACFIGATGAGDFSERTYTNVRSDLGLVIGTNVQAWDAQLDSLASLAYGSNALKVVRVNAGETAFELATLAGGGDVTGPGSSTDNGLPRFDGTGGKTLQTSQASVDDDGEVRTAINSGACPAVLPSTMWVMLTADYTLTNSGAEQKFFNTTTNGTLTLPTGVYAFEWFAYLTGMSGTSGNAAFDPIGAGTAVTDRWGQQAWGIDNNSPLAAGARGGSASVTQQTTASAVTAATGTGMVATMNGMFRISTGGTIIPSITLVTAAAAVAKAGSYFKIERVGDSTETYVGAWT